MKAISVDSVEGKRIEMADGTSRVVTWYSGHLSSEVEPGAQAFRVQMVDPRTYLAPHFHDVSQFQVFCGGDGLLGDDPIAPMTVFYTDAFTSYGPIVAGGSGLSFFTLRCQHDAGIRWMPKDRALRQPTVGRRTVRTFDPGATDNDPAQLPAGYVRIDEARRDDDGMAISFLVAGPDASLTEHFQAATPHEYAVVMSGSAVANGVTLPALSLLLDEDDDGRVELRSGAAGVTIALLEFPVRDRERAHA